MEDDNRTTTLPQTTSTIAYWWITCLTIEGQWAIVDSIHDTEKAARTRARLEGRGLIPLPIFAQPNARKPRLGERLTLTKDCSGALAPMVQA
jgi:hypothetical protein